MDLISLTISHAADLISRGELSPVELVDAHLARIDRIDANLNCYITIMAEQALAQARTAETELRHGSYRGPLHGIPLALKDLYETEGVRTTAGSLFYKDKIPAEDAFVVQKLKAAGAVLLGKLNMHEIALGVTNNNPHFGPCHNPWQIERTPGGSSGGCAAALSARLCMGALGTDTGGSIRIPASLCGVVGMKPTYGRVSLRGVVPLSWSLDHAGTMARTARDAAILLQAIAGYDPFDPASINTPVPDYLANIKAGVSGLKIALADDEFFTKVDLQVLNAVQTAADVFADLGAQISRVEIAHGKEAAQANGLIVTSEAAAFHRDRLSEHPDMFGTDVRQRLETGAAYTSTEYILARRLGVEFRRQMERFFEDYDLLLTPTTPITAPPLEGPNAVEQARILTSFTAPFNLSGLPALSIPCGFSSQGLPVGLQLIARPWAEAKLLRAAEAYQNATDWHLREPELAGGGVGPM